MTVLFLFLSLLYQQGALPQDPFKTDPLPDAPDQIKLLCSNYGIPVGDANVRADCLLNEQTGERKFKLSIDESLLPKETRTLRCVMVYWDDKSPSPHEVTVETQSMYVPDDPEPKKKKKKGEQSELLPSSRANSVLETDEYIFPVKSMLSIQLYFFRANGKPLGSARSVQLAPKPVVPPSVDGGTPPPNRKSWPPIRPA